MTHKIQLVRCPIDDHNIAADQWNMPLDLMLLADAVADICEVEILDGTLLGLSGIEAALDPKADIIGFTYTALSSKTLGHLSVIAKDNGSFVIVGGQPAIAAAKSLIQEPSIDAVCVGDGQPTLSTLSLQMIDGHISPNKVPNLMLFINGNFEITHSVQEDVWNQRLPQRAIGGLDPQAYFSNYPKTNTLVNMRGLRAANIYSKRGCPHRCSFCARQDKILRTRSPELVIDEIRNLIDKYGVDYILDTSDTWIEYNWMNEYIKHYSFLNQNKINMMVFADVRDMSPETAQTMKRCGVDSVLFGVESGSERILRHNGKRTTKREILNAVDCLVDNDIRVSCSFVLGLLDEDEDSLMETIELTRELHSKPHVLCYGNVIMPLMGSWLWERAFPEEKTWPSFITRSIDYNLNLARELFIHTSTNVQGGLQTLEYACGEILQSSGLPIKEYAR
jgi:anaerobic magnesium-protoporphyrin IX monomethyl ester cyclase